MKAKKYSEEQTIGALQEVDRGSKVDDVCRRLGVGKVTFYRWKAKFSGMQASDAKRLRQLEDENRRLKHMVADQALDIPDPSDRKVRRAFCRPGGGRYSSATRSSATSNWAIEVAGSNPAASVPPT